MAVETEAAWAADTNASLEARSATSARGPLSAGTRVGRRAQTGRWRAEKQLDR